MNSPSKYLIRTISGRSGYYIYTFNWHYGLQRKFADRIREALINQPDIAEKTMFSGVTFMVNGKMGISVSRDDLMCCIDPDLFEQEIECNGVRPMVMGGERISLRE